MNLKELHEMSNRHQVKKHCMFHMMIAFISGGFVSIVAQFICDIFSKSFSNENAIIITTLLLIFMSSIATGLGIYDKAGKYAGGGLFVPITGFSNALTSSAMECKHEGLIYGIGSNMFKLAGSVITYGIVSAIIFSLITYGVGLL
ncbi:MAG: SpoVA/SpoVAEb family sporulation membrane protein [Traorella sp.]